MKDLDGQLIVKSWVAPLSARIGNLRFKYQEYKNCEEQFFVLSALFGETHQTCERVLGINFYFEHQAFVP